MVCNVAIFQSPPPDFLRNAIVARAHRNAEMVDRWIRLLLKRPEGEIVLPANFLLELGAIICLAEWESLGLRQFLPDDLPASRVAMYELGARAKKGSSEFEGPDAAPLSIRVFQVWLENFAWQGPELLQAELIVGNVDEDVFADLLADLIWKNRRELTQLLNTPQVG